MEDKYTKSDASMKMIRKGGDLKRKRKSRRRRRREEGGGTSWGGGEGGGTAEGPDGVGEGNLSAVDESDIPHTPPEERTRDVASQSARSYRGR